MACLPRPQTLTRKVMQLKLRLHTLQGAIFAYCMSMAED